MQENKRSKRWLTQCASLFLLFALFSCNSVYEELEKNMVDIPSGSFVLGSESDDADPDENPAHTVSVPGFRLCRYEVSQKLWTSVMGKNPSVHKGMRYPVEGVSIPDIEKFLYKLNKTTGKNYRLPTETEWEYAASLGIENLLLDDIAWYSANSGNQTHTCGEKMPDDLGLFDLIGNVLEWCSDTYDGCNYSGDPVIEVDSTQVEGVFRGGAFYAEKWQCRRSNRNHAPQTVRNYAIGLRLAE